MMSVNVQHQYLTHPTSYQQHKAQDKTDIAWLTLNVLIGGGISSPSVRMWRRLRTRWCRVSGIRRTWSGAFHLQTYTIVNKLFTWPIRVYSTAEIVMNHRSTDPESATLQGSTASNNNLSMVGSCYYSTLCWRCLVFVKHEENKTSKFAYHNYMWWVTIAALILDTVYDQL